MTWNLKVFMIIILLIAMIISILVLLRKNNQSFQLYDIEFSKNRIIFLLDQKNLNKTSDSIDCLKIAIKEANRATKYGGNIRMKDYDLAGLIIKVYNKCMREKGYKGY